VQPLLYLTAMVEAHLHGGHRHLRRVDDGPVLTLPGRRGAGVVQREAQPIRRRIPECEIVELEGADAREGELGIQARRIGEIDVERHAARRLQPAAFETQLTGPKAGRFVSDDVEIPTRSIASASI
jgi:hypothetical protein